SIDTRGSGLHRDRVRMSVRDDREPLARRPHRVEKVRRTREIVDQVQMAALEIDDVETELRAPMLDAVPLEATEEARIALGDLAMRVLEADPSPFRVARRHELEPEEVVEREV